MGAYLKIIRNCDFVSYNVRPPGGGLKGLGELDVVGFHFPTKTVFVCEVTTHITGLLIQDRRRTLERIKEKHIRQKSYAESQLSDFPTRVYEFWSPVVTRTWVQDLVDIDPGLTIVVNEVYANRFDELSVAASKRANDEGNPVFRLLQIQQRLRRTQ